jgi:hypothetical protein
MAKKIKEEEEVLIVLETIETKEVTSEETTPGHNTRAFRQ